jgi:hypothetical protein
MAEVATDQRPSMVEVATDQQTEGASPERAAARENSENVGFDQGCKREPSRAHWANDDFYCVSIGDRVRGRCPKTSVQLRFIIISAADVLWSITPGTGRGPCYQRSRGTP